MDSHADLQIPGLTYDALLTFPLHKPPKTHELNPWITTGKGAGDPPNSLAVDARSNVYLTGRGNIVGLIQKFSPAGFFFFLMMRRPPSSTLFPSTALFR